MNELTALLQRGESSIRLRQGVVSSVSGGIAKVSVGSAEINARYLKPAPSPGDTVLMTYLSNNPVVLGAFASKTTTLVDGEGEQDA